MDSCKFSSFPYIVWQRLFAWVVTSSLVNPFAILIGAVAGFVVVHPNLQPFIGQPPSKPLTILLLQALANSIVAGSMIGIAQRLILHQFIEIRFWTLATIIGLAFGMVFFYGSIDRGWIHSPGWDNFWLIVPAISVAIPQALLIYREGFTPIWWLLAGEASIATTLFTSGMGSAFDSFLEQSIRAVAFACLGALFSAVALFVTFRKKLALPKGSTPDIS